MGNDDVKLIQKLFALYKKLPIKNLCEYIDNAISLDTKVFLLDYKEKHYPHKSTDFTI